MNDVEIIWFIVYIIAAIATGSVVGGFSLDWLYHRYGNKREISPVVWLSLAAVSTISLIGYLIIMI